MADQERVSPSEQVARLYEEVEAQAARASEHLVGTRGFAGLLGQMAENSAALARLAADSFDLVLRNLRLAGRRDVVRLARQLARTEDKLERVLQEVEELRDQLLPLSGADASGSSARRSPAGGRQARPHGSRSATDGAPGRANATPSRQQRNRS
jgi:hypothetical protein